MTNLEALNSLAEKVGGEAQESNAKAIKEIADNFSGGGGGGGEIFDVIVVLTNPEDPTAATTTTTTAEAQAAWDAGKRIHVIAKMGSSTGSTFFEGYADALTQTAWFALVPDQGVLFCVNLSKMEDLNVPLEASVAMYELTPMQ